MRGLEPRQISGDETWTIAGAFESGDVFVQHFGEIVNQAMTWLEVLAVVAAVYVVLRTRYWLTVVSLLQDASAAIESRRDLAFRRAEHRRVMHDTVLNSLEAIANFDMLAAEDIRTRCRQDLELLHGQELASVDELFSALHDRAKALAIDLRTFSGGNSRGLPPSQLRALEMVGIELLNNAAKHSMSRQLGLAVHVSPNREFVLVVQSPDTWDVGGLDSSLASIRARASDEGWTLSLESRGSATRLEIRSHDKPGQVRAGAARVPMPREVVWFQRFGFVLIAVAVIAAVPRVGIPGGLVMTTAFVLTVATCTSETKIARFAAPLFAASLVVAVGHHAEFSVAMTLSLLAVLISVSLGRLEDWAGRLVVAVVTVPVVILSAAYCGSHPTRILAWLVTVAVVSAALICVAHGHSVGSTCSSPELQEVEERCVGMVRLIANESLDPAEISTVIACQELASSLRGALRGKPESRTGGLSLDRS